jgi:hypothetical protein
LFGGYDTAKYSGQLIGLKYGNVLLSAPLQAVEITNSSGVISNVWVYEDTITAILDCGGPVFSNLPDGAYQAVVNYFEGFGYVVTDDMSIGCGSHLLEGSIGLTFTDRSGNQATNLYFGNTITISVPFSELIVPTFDVATGLVTKCTLGIQNGGSSGTNVFFGDKFLRSMYIVSAQDWGVVALAQAKIAVTESSIVPVTSPTSRASHSKFL